MTDRRSAPDAGGRALVDELSYHECMDLLATEHVGRLAVVVGHYPQVFCVNYRLDDFVVVFRSGMGTKVLAADHANVGFEVDHLDSAQRSGWSVLIQGMAEDVTDRDGDTSIDRARHLNVDSWAVTGQGRLIRIIPAKITGRRIVLHELGG